MFVGNVHARNGHVESRCSGKLLMINVGISVLDGGHSSAVEIQGGFTNTATEITMNSIGSVRKIPLPMTSGDDWGWFHDVDS
jgi:hypothetical protein